jgi:hypothetical protein
MPIVIMVVIGLAPVIAVSTGRAIVVTVGLPLRLFRLP